MQEKWKKPQVPPAVVPAEATPSPAPTSRRVREVQLTAKEKSLAAKKAARARWMLQNP